MNNFDIFADSSANLPDELTESYDIQIIPYTCIVNGAEKPAAAAGTPFQTLAKAHYAMMRAGADTKTSLIGESAFVKALTPSLEAGRDVLLVTITASISGTNAQAMRARETLLKQYPDRNIFIVDSANASLGEGLLVLGAAKQRAAGADVSAAAQWVEDNKYLLNSQVTVAELKYLHRSGRVSGILAFAGALLNLKPMLRADGSTPAKLVVYGKEKGRKKALAELLRAFDAGVVDLPSQTIAIAHADCEEEALALRDELVARGASDVIVEYYDLCTGSHVGPGTIALFYFGKDRRAALVPEKRPLLVRRKNPVKT